MSLNVKKNAIYELLLVFVILVTANVNWYQKNQCAISYYEKNDFNKINQCGILKGESYIPKEAQPYTKNKLANVKSDDISLYAKAACVIDADSRRCLYGKDPNSQYPMASTTKIMTCLYTIETSNLDDVVTISANAASQPKVHLGMKEGDRFVLRDLLYGLMLESYNDCAVAIAEHVSGSVEAFCKEMTRKAHDLGCVHTQFITPNGLDAQGHYTTAEELAIIGSYCVKNASFLEITNTKEYQFQEITKGTMYKVHNKNRFLDQYPGAIGMKTGYTSKASYCFVGAVRQNQKTFISVVLASGWYPKKNYKWVDTKKLMDYATKNYKTIPVLLPSCQFAMPNIVKGRKKKILVGENEQIATMLKPDDVVSYQITWINKEIKAPVCTGQVVGYLKIMINGKCYKKIPVQTMEDVKEWTYPWCLKHLIRQFCE